MGYRVESSGLRLDQNAEIALLHAQIEADQKNSPYVATEHLVLGLMRQTGHPPHYLPAGQVLEALGVDRSMIDRQVNYRFIRNPLIRQEPHFGSTFADSSGLHNVIANAMQQAVMEKRGAASDLDLLSEMVRWDAGIGSRILKSLNVTRVRIDEATAKLGLKPNTNPP